MPTVKVKHTKRLSVDPVERPQRWEGQAVVAAQGDELGLPLANGAGRPGAAKGLESLSHLFTSNCIVKGRDGNVAAVDNPGPTRVRIDVGAGIEAAE